MAQEYTPSGSPVAFTIPVYADVVDGETLFKALADDMWAAAAAAVASVPAPNLTVTTKTASYTAAAGDANGLVAMNSASGTTITLPQDSAATIAVGATVSGLRLGAGSVAFLAGAGATVYATPGLVLRAQYSFATALKIAANTWLVTGDVTA